MLTPSVATRFTWFYAAGNTPATSLTRSVPNGEDAEVLSLGCGDLRNILYTAYLENGLSPRKLDFTCCDIDEKIIGRNLVLLTLIIDNDASISALWDIYYHLYVDASTSTIIQNQADKLIPLLENPKTWAASKYGKTIKFCDADTLRDVLRIIQRVAFAARNGSSRDRHEQFEANVKRTKDIRDKTLGGENAAVLTGMRSAAPLSLQSKLELPAAHTQYWKEGTVMTKAAKTSLPNPMFAGLLSDSEVLHYGTDPVLGFHLATAYAPLAAGSPLKAGVNEENFKPAIAAMKQFERWVFSLRKLLHKGSMAIRFAVADVFAFCHSLRHAASSDGPSNWYRRQFDIKPLVLDPEKYGKGKKGPMEFDMIDSSNLSDHFGALNILVATAPLLKAKPWATVNTDLMLKRGETEQKAFSNLLCGDAITMSLLLGVSPVQYWTNAKVESHTDEIFASLMATEGHKGHQEMQLFSRMAWKRDDQFSGQIEGRGGIHVNATTLARMLFEVYLEMFKGERLETSLANMQTRSMAYCNFHRGSFAVLLKLVKHRVVTDWDAMCKALLDKIATDRELGLSSNYVQELCAQLYRLDVVDEPWVLQPPSQRPETGVLKNWSNIPPVVAVTITVPLETVLQLYKSSQQGEIASPTLVASLRSAPSAPTVWHNMYSDVHLSVGSIETSGPRDTEDLKLNVKPDRLGWDGSSPLVASFYAPASSLQVQPLNTLVGLYLTPTSQNMAVYGPVIGADMKLWELSLLSKSDVFVSKYLPGQTCYPTSCGSLTSLKEAIDGHDGAVSSKITAEVPASESHISTLTGRLDIISEKGKKLLKDKVAIELRQKNPFTIEVVFSKDNLVYDVTFPAPVTKEGSKTRVARTTGYIEVIAPFATPASSSCLADFVFPSSLSSSGLPSSLNAPHTNLDRLPVLDLEQKPEMRWLSTLTSFHFSTREKRIRDSRDSSGISNDPRVNFKESIFTMFMLASGLQGEETGLFAISHPGKGGIHMLILVSALRLDGDTSSVVLDAAILPFTQDLVKDRNMQQFLLVVESMKCASMTVNDAELVLWKKALPSMVERCRTWTHGPKCEYKKKSATIPLSLEDGEQLLCSCGNGKLPDNFVGIPEWEHGAPHATRVAITPTFAVPYVEDVADTSTFRKPKQNAAAKGSGEVCRACGKTSAVDGGALKRCQRCQGVKYCSVECQRKDWKSHKKQRQP